MAGVKGRSGGSRPNTGGARPGAGRKPKSANAPAPTPAAPPAPAEAPAADMDMLQWLQAVALGKVQANTVQVRAAVAAVQYTHTRRADGGKKEAAAESASKAGRGKFASASPPKLVVSNGR